MKVITLENAEQIGEQLGRFYVDFVKANPACVLGLATGATPVPTYRQIVKAYQAGEVSFANVTTFNLDEYCDLPKDNKNSYYTFMQENLFQYLDIKAENINFLDGNAADYEAESRRYAAAIQAAGGIDVQFLGIGRNGHIAFNEPSDSFTDEAFRVALTQSTIDANSIYFEGMLEGEVTPQLPASVLQQHPDVTVYLDKEAAALLEK